MLRVITYGTFDYFHYGHYNLLKRASKLGDELYVGVSSDNMCAEKGKAPLLNQCTRSQVISDLSFVNTVFIENDMTQKVEDVKRYHIDIFVLGSDYKDIFPQMPEYRQLLDLGCKIVFLERTQGVSTSTIKDNLAKQAQLDQAASSLHKLTNK